MTQKEIFEDRILRPVGEAAQNTKRIRYGVAGFMAQEGCRYNKQLMVVGRSTSGGGTRDSCSNPAEFADSEFREEFSGRFRNDDDCPMKWIKDRPGKYNPNKSAFWRVIRQVTTELEICAPGCEDWASCLVWSNLYKVSRARTWNANPNVSLRKAQFEGCRELLIREIQDFRPERLLLLTGYWANPFFKDNPVWDICSPGGTDPKPDCILYTARSSCPGLSNTQVVVAEHPQTRPKQKFVKEVIKAFE